MKSLEGDIVTVNLKGACDGCPSATITLKDGIETLLKEKLPEPGSVKNRKNTAPEKGKTTLLEVKNA